MKMRFVLMTMFAVMAISCTKENLPENNMTDAKPALVPMEFVAGLETKAAITDITGTQCVVEWNDNDAISVFDNLGGINAFTTQTGGATAVFAGQVSEGATEFYALYPSRTNLEFAADTKIATSKLFPDQNAVLGSYASGNGGAVMAAKVSEGNLLSFKNMTSHIRFTLAEDLTDVKSITLMGNKGEAVAGLYTIDFSGDVPVLAVSKPETYVTLRNANGEALTPGDYFFTILPVEFTEGFTVILSKTDGTQVAKKTAKNIDSVKERNKILPMAKLASTDYASHLNYFVKYNDGFNLTFGGYTFNKEKYTSATRVAANNPSIAADGLYFVAPSVSASVDYNASSLMVIGEDASQHSTVAQPKNSQPKTKDGILMFANLDYTLKRIEVKVDAYDKIIFDNCKIYNNQENFLRMNDNAVVINDFVVKDCDIELTSATPKFVTGNKAGTKLVNVEFSNNVFYPKDGVTITSFILLNEGSAGAVEYTNIILSYNTFEKTATDKTFVVATTASTSVDINYNVFLECNPTEGLRYVLPTVPAEISVLNNFTYLGAQTKGIQIYSGFEGNNPKNVADPRPVNWSPATGICYLKTITYNEHEFNAGAQRTVVEPDNSAAANYSSVDLGNL